MKKLIIFIALFICGCGGNYGNNADNYKKSNMLPTEAHNVRDLGNQWILFDLTIEGKKKQFLFRKPSGSHGECITEVSQ